MKHLIKKLLREALTDANQGSCEIFQLETGLSYYDTMMEKPLYYLISKWFMAKIVYMSPKEYLTIVADGFGNQLEDQIEWVERSPNKVKELMDKMKSGIKIDMVHYQEGTSNQEGRHRAYAAWKLGCDKIPVLKVNEVDIEEIEDIVSKIGDKSFEEVDKIFRDKGYPEGITKLGYRDMKRKYEQLG